MGKGIKEEARAQELELVSLSELIHQHVRAAIETAVHEELRAALGTSPYERRDVRRAYRNGVRERTLTGPTGPVALTLPRATLFSGAGDVKEWTSRIVPRYQRRIPEVNEAVIATYLAGGKTCRIRGVSGAGDHRRQCRAAARRRARLAQGCGPTVLRAQAAQS